jgi:serine O-acetyltransferase
MKKGGYMSEFILRNMTVENLSGYVARQLSMYFPDGSVISADTIRPYMSDALERTHVCFAGIEKKKFREAEQVMFNYMHPDHYAMFLYLLSNTVSRSDRENPLAFRLFYLNKVLHGLDVYHDTELPPVFQFMHPLGTILGQAEYGNYFCVYQGCSVGCDEQGVFPVIGEHVVLYAGASVIGRSRIGNNVVVGANVMLLDRDVPDSKVVLGGASDLQIRDNVRHVLERRFR